MFSKMLSILFKYLKRLLYIEKVRFFVQSSAVSFARYPLRFTQSDINVWTENRSNFEILFELFFRTFKLRHI